jgi:hypothetical protein
VGYFSAGVDDDGAQRIAKQYYHPFAEQNIHDLLRFQQRGQSLNHNLLSNLSYCQLASQLYTR